MLKHYIIPLFLLLTTSSFAQSLKDIKQAEIAHQKCLDQGGYMLGCSRDFYALSDSLLNVVYNKVRNQLTPEAKEKLKTEQLAWLKKRDAYFKKEFQNLKDERQVDEDSQDFKMIMYDIKANFVMERVKYFIHKLE